MEISTLTGAWRRLVLMTVVAVLAALLTSVGASSASAAAPEAPPVKAATTKAAAGQMKRVCPHNGDPSEFPQCRQGYSSPSTMKAKFQRGTYRTANGIKMPAWVYGAAKRYYQNHPGQIPDRYKNRSGRNARGWDVDWGGLIGWTGKALNTTRCVGYSYTPIGWFGCNDIPDWAKATRNVTMKCGGTVLIIAVATRSPVAVGSGGATCLWGIFSD